MVELSGFRPRFEIEAALAAAQEELPYATRKPFIQGAIVALEWLLGQAGAAPASGASVDPALAIAQAEEDSADDAIYGRPGAPNLERGRAVGIQHALMWARGAADSAPVPI